MKHNLLDKQPSSVGGNFEYNVLGLLGFVQQGA